MKAHSFRRLRLTEVLVLESNDSDTGRRHRDFLIAPVARKVLFTPSVASARGLATTSGFSKSDELKDLWRWYNPPLSEFQAADGSISHDGGFAVAVVQALNQPSESDIEPESLHDDGLDEPRHVPMKGDSTYPVLLQSSNLLTLLVAEHEPS